MLKEICFTTNENRSGRTKLVGNMKKRRILGNKANDLSKRVKAAS